jgi:hypothetical protein
MVATQLGVQMGHFDRENDGKPWDFGVSWFQTNLVGTCNGKRRIGRKFSSFAGLRSSTPQFIDQLIRSHSYVYLTIITR